MGESYVALSYCHEIQPSVWNFHTSAMGIFETQPVGNIGTSISEGDLVGTGGNIPERAVLNP